MKSSVTGQTAGVISAATRGGDATVASPARRIRPVRRRHPFDLRRTAVFFGLLAVLLIIVGFAARTVVDLVERRPAWALALGLAGSAGALSLWRHRHRLSVARAARRAGAALDEAAKTAADAWDAPSRSGGVADVPVDTADQWPVAAPSAGRTGAAGGAGTGEAAGTAGPSGGSGVAGSPGRGRAVLDPIGTAAAGTAGDAGPQARDGLGTLDPDEFEHAVAALCVRDGCREAEVAGGAGDLGADVLAVAPDGRRVVIQCKRYGDGTTVGSQDLQRFGGTCFAVHRADVAVVVTTSGFTAPALDYADQCGIVCVDGPALRAWHDGTGPRPWETRDVEGRP